MKNKLPIVFFSVFAVGAYAQQSVNSGAVSGNGLIHSVGEIYVIPANANQASSGTIGAVSRIEFLTLGIDEVVAAPSIKVYPNPTAHSVFFETGAEPITHVDIYDTNGRVVLSKDLQNNQVDLSQLQAGTYIITTNSKSNQSFKIIKK